MNASQLFETVASLPLQVLIVVIAVVLLSRFVDQAASSCRLWTIGFLSILGLIAVGFMFPHLRLIQNGGGLSESAARTLFVAQVWFVKIMAVVWIIGFSGVLLRRLGRMIVLSQFFSQRCRVMTDEEISTLPLGDQDALPEGLRLLVSFDAHGPFCWQLQRPTIVLPSCLLREDEDEDVLRHVLLHELEHLRTNHPLQHFLQGACNALLWFHPAIWWAARNAELTREFHCDEVAANAGNTIASYLKTLAKIAEQNRAAPTCTLAFGRRKSAIIRRTEHLVSRIESKGDQRSSRDQRRTSLAIGCLFLLVLVVSQLWLPVNVLASSRTRVSPWPNWTAEILHDFGVSVRDYERFDARHDLNVLASDDED
ncbi:M56 family metallopeptidase [Stieleria sp. ICT_E10.1]|uniref:M56 family metallopeptidase n=1 Tax=Stieleria sedimenti TaxID=2976331 RepID=UPI00217F454D|nr:M56 family metallopeptidase [Stieleria sedimenti]MCS7471430.1 M56 family metallopeptidase [Stieleria sedimenti]